MFKKKFFEDGFVSNIAILDKNTAKKIAEEYINFNSRCNKRHLSVEHKSKTHLFFEWANKIIHDEKIKSMVAEIIGPNYYCWNSLIFFKKPRSKNFVSMHQDQNYWGIENDKALTVSLALTDSNIKNGCIKLLPKSHLKKFEHKDFFSMHNMLARGQSVFLKKELSDQLYNVELKSGECCIFHGNIVHGSGVNNSDNVRLLYSMRFLTTDNKVNEKLYYKEATLISGVDNYNFFKKEPTFANSNIKILRKKHKQILIEQFSKYLYLKTKSNILTKILMIFFKIDIFRSLIYLIIKKT